MVQGLELTLRTLGTLETAVSCTIVPPMPIQTGRADPESTLVTPVPEEVPGLLCLATLTRKLIIAVLTHLDLLGPPGPHLLITSQVQKPQKRRLI
jgi:hypothetical protein